MLHRHLLLLTHHHLLLLMSHSAAMWHAAHIRMMMLLMVGRHRWMVWSATTTHSPLHMHHLLLRHVHARVVGVIGMVGVHM